MPPNHRSLPLRQRLDANVTGRIFAIAALALLPSLAFAQVQPSGVFTPGHTVKALTATGRAVGDAGGAAGGPAGTGLTEIGITATGLPFCINDGPTTGPYHQLCLGASALGGGLINFGAQNGASPTSLSIEINGVVYPFPGAGTGDVVGPGSSPAGGIIVFNGTTGKLIKDSGIGASLLAGNQSGSNPWLNGLIEQTPGEISTLLHGIFTTNVSSFLGISADMTAANDPTNTVATTSPRNGLTVLSTNKGSAADVVGAMLMTQCTVGSTVCFGANILALGGGTLASKKLVGLEIDQEFTIGDTATAGSAGLYINTFNVAGAGPAIQLGAVSGTWTNGFQCGGVASTGSCLAVVGGSAAPDSLINTSLAAGYTSGAIRIANNNGTGFSAGANNQVLRIEPTSGNPSVLHMNADNNLILGNGNASGNNYFIHSGGGSTLIGTTNALATNAVKGFLYIPSGGGLPTGTPDFLPSWANAITIDTSDNKLCFYTTAWKCVTGS
jgi:hypothetical protein